ncbi:MAG: SPOR domain-containing protein [Spirochaetaceae bacterium]
MTEEAKKEINDTKISTDTLFVLLLIICGLAAILLVGYLLYKPYQATNDVVIRDIVVSGITEEERNLIESVQDSLENSYLDETDGTETVDGDKVGDNKEDAVVIEDKPIFKPQSNKTLKQTATKTTVVKKPTTPEQKLITVKAYWIQVGSFSTTSQANKSVSLLKEKGLSSRVVLSSVNGKSVYRVRIGAYESKDEADKFTTEVRKIEGFEESYVSESTTQKYVDK